MLTYQRGGDSARWDLASAFFKGADGSRRRVPGGLLPPSWRSVSACAGSHVPVRTAKIHASFRRELLDRMLEAQRVLCHMLLFKCKVCKRRFPAFHPGFSPREIGDLQSVRHLGLEVESFDEAPERSRSYLPPFHTGTCSRCARSLRDVEDDPLLRGVATSAASTIRTPSTAWASPR